MKTLDARARSGPEPGEFAAIRAWLHREAGIWLAETKHALVAGRLASRLAATGCASYGAYLARLKDPAHAGERQTAIDRLTTNETHFFREPKHFDLLHRLAAQRPPGARPLRVWSAACSSGEEPYSIAMALARAMGPASWEVLASDLSVRVLERARAGHYAIARARTIPAELLHAYCLRGVGPQEATFLVSPQLRRRVTFRQVNLVEPLPGLGEFDVVFLRNVMIYFDAPVKRLVVERILGCLKPGGLLLVGHAETLAGHSPSLVAVAPSVYRRG